MHIMQLPIDSNSLLSNIYINEAPCQLNGMMTQDVPIFNRVITAESIDALSNHDWSICKINILYKNLLFLVEDKEVCR